MDLLDEINSETIERMRAHFSEPTTYDRFTFFWQRFSVFSQWHPAVFRIAGVTYNCAEQYMMAAKARKFGDVDTLICILNADDPKKQKQLGRVVVDFDQDVWTKAARDYVYLGTWAKFSQNPGMKEALLATAGTTLVEASPYDSIWGIGLRSDDPRADDRSTWLGHNWLGEILTHVRDEFTDLEI